jgi:hypothetical protein
MSRSLSNLTRVLFFSEVLPSNSKSVLSNNIDTGNFMTAGSTWIHASNLTAEVMCRVTTSPFGKKTLPFVFPSKRFQSSGVESTCETHCRRRSCCCHPVTWRTRLLLPAEISSTWHTVSGHSKMNNTSRDGKEDNFITGSKCLRCGRLADYNKYCWSGNIVPNIVHPRPNPLHPMFPRLTNSGTGTFTRAH